MDVYERLDLLREAAARMSVAWDNLDPERGLEACCTCMRQLQEIAPELVAQGVQAGLTQRRMAKLLGVPESTLRGAKREFAR